MHELQREWKMHELPGNWADSWEGNEVWNLRRKRALPGLPGLRRAKLVTSWDRFDGAGEQACSRRVGGTQ